MKAKQLIVGCVLAIGGIGVAAAANVNIRDTAGVPHASIDTNGHDNGGSTSSGEAAGVTHDCGLPGPTSGSDSGNGGGSASDGDNSNPRSHRAGLSWQSLLPGSIQ